MPRRTPPPRAPWSMTRCTKPALPAPLRNLPPLTLLSRLVPASRRGTARTHNRMPSKVRENYRRATTCCEQACGGRRGETRRERGTVQQSPRVSTPHAEAIRSGSVRFMGVGSGARVRAGWIGEKKGQNPERTMNVQIAVWVSDHTQDLAPMLAPRPEVAAPHVVGCALTLWASSAAPAPFALRFEHSNDVHLACLETEI